MKIADLMTTSFTTCRPEDTLDRAAEIMWDEDCGSVPVVDRSGQPVAMVTDRDVCMAASFQGSRLAECQVQQAMSRGVRTCEEGQSTEDAHTILREHQLHRLPVVNKKGRLVGLVSLSDLVHRSGASKAAERRELADELLTTLSAICHPRGAAAPTLKTAEKTKEKTKTVPAAAPRQSTAKPAPKTKKKAAKKRTRS